MKRYIFLTPSIQNMGGAELYVRSKMVWLRHNGWSVDVVYIKGETIYIPEFKDCKYCISELKYPTFCYNKYRRKKILGNLINICHGSSTYEEIVIESTSVSISTWGELLSSEIHAKHLLYTLQEDNTISNDSLIKYLLFKYGRKELAGILPRSIYDMLHQVTDVKINNDYFLSAKQGNPVEDIDHPFVELIKDSTYDYVIGSVCRLDKPCILPTYKEVLNYIICHPDKKFILLLIGDAPKETGITEYIKNEATKVPNLQLFITGYLYPVPLRLIRLCDVCYSTSGSAYLSAKVGVPTISIDGKDFLPIGIVNYTTKNRLFRDNEPIRPISEYFDEILIKHTYPITDAEPYPEVDYQDHLSFLSHSSLTKDYYDIHSLSWNSNQVIQKILMPIIGPYAYDKWISSMKKIIQSTH